MRGSAGFIALCFFALFSTGTSAAETPPSVVFGQIQLTGNNAIAEAWRLVVKEVDTRKTETIVLEQRKATGVLYDFAAPLPPGRYHLYMLKAPKVDWEHRLTKPEQYFELKPGAVLYLGNWLVQPGFGRTKTVYSVKYDLDEVGLFAKANPDMAPSRFAVGVLDKAAVPLTTQ